MGGEVNIAMRGVKNKLYRQGSKSHTVPFALQGKVGGGYVAAGPSRILIRPTITGVGISIGLRLNGTHFKEEVVYRWSLC